MRAPSAPHRNQHARLPQADARQAPARLPDRAVVSHCYTDWFNPRQAEQTLTRLALAAESLGQHRIQPLRLCWVFEHARILLALRRDAACLGLFVENRPELSTAALLEKIATNTKYLEMLQEEGTEEAENRIENIRELLTAAAESHERGENLRDFLDHAALVSDQDAYDEASPILVSKFWSCDSRPRLPESEESSATRNDA